MITYTDIGGSLGQARSAGFEANTWGRTYTRHWQAETDSQEIGPRAVLLACPVAVGDTYEDGAATESDAGSFCQRISVTEDTSAGDGCTWTVSAEYGPYNVNTQAPELPLTARPKLSFGWAEFQKVQTEDANGDPIVNSAGDPFNDPPVLQDVAWPLMMITRNEAGYDLSLVAACKGKINNATWFGRPAKWWKCVNITADEAQDPDGAIYFVVTYEFAMNPTEWTEKMLDVGMREINGSGKKVKITDDKGNFVSDPWPLNSDGTKKAVGSTADWLTFDTHEAIDFSVFNLDTFYNDEVTAGRLI